MRSITNYKLTYTILYDIITHILMLVVNMNLYRDSLGKEIVQNSIIEVKKDKKTKYFLIEDEPIYADGFIRLTGKYLMKNFSLDYRIDDNCVVERIENIKVIGIKEEIKIIKFLYKKDFVKAFKNKCISDNIKQNDFIKQAMTEFILKNTK